jgi:hypothetical protein
MKKGPITIFYFILACAVASCGGGGSSNSGNTTSSSNSETSDNSNNDSAINNGLGGRLVVFTRAFGDDVDSAYFMDLETGRYTVIPNTNLEDQANRFPLSLLDPSISVSEALGLIAVTVEDCKSFSIGTNYSCLAVQDFSGNIIAEFDVLNDVTQAKLSPDGLFLALFRELSDDRLEIYDLSGNLVSSLLADKGSLDWLPDGRLVFAYQDRALAITEPYSTDIDNEESVALPSTIEDGRISFISVSPDGRKVAFGIITDSTLTTTDATFWMFDRDTRWLRRIATIPSSSQIDPMFSHSAWSPDGSHIAVLEGGFGGSNSLNPGGLPGLYILPSNADQPLIVSIDPDLRSEGVILVRGYREPDNDPDDQVQNTFFDDSFDFYWLSE